MKRFVILYLLAINLSVSGQTTDWVKSFGGTASDKGISIGEKTSIKIKDLKITSSKTGIAVKDSSFAEVEKFVGNNLESCFQIYQKKQEFGPAYLKLYNQDCMGINNNFIQEGSVYEY